MASALAMICVLHNDGHSCLGVARSSLSNPCSGHRSESDSVIREEKSDEQMKKKTEIDQCMPSEVGQLGTEASRQSR